MFCNFISFQNLNICSFIYCSLTKSCPTLQPHGLQHVRLPCLSLSPRVCSNSWSLSPWCHLISSLTPFSSCPHLNLFQHQGLSNESALCIMWPKYWSFNFNISPSKEHPGLISVTMDWLDLLASPRDSQESSPTPQFKSINSLALSFLYGPTLTPIHDCWKNHSFD